MRQRNVRCIEETASRTVPAAIFTPVRHRRSRHQDYSARAVNRPPGRRMPGTHTRPETCGGKSDPLRCRGRRRRAWPTSWSRYSRLGNSPGWSGRARAAASPSAATPRSSRCSPPPASGCPSWPACYAVTSTCGSGNSRSTAGRQGPDRQDRPPGRPQPGPVPARPLPARRGLAAPAVAGNQQPGAAGRRLISHLTCAIVTGRRLVSLSVCPRWLPLWLPDPQAESHRVTHL
jgi:hypothetical protein